MGLFDYFRGQKKTSASLAKERLQVIVARDRGTRSGPDYLPALQLDILDVVRRYVAIDDDAVRVQVEREGDYEVLELNVVLPDED